MNVRVTLQSVMRMQCVTILKAALSAAVLRDTQGVVTLETALVCVSTTVCELYQTIVKFSDVDECELNIDGCEQGCVNTDGSFMCNCTDGYVLNEDGFACDGKSSCALIIIILCMTILMQTLMSVHWILTAVLKDATIQLVVLTVLALRDMY